MYEVDVTPVTSDGLHTIGYWGQSTGYWLGNMVTVASEASWTPVTFGFRWVNKATGAIYFVNSDMKWERDDIPY